MPDNVLNEDGTQIVLEDGTGNVILESDVVIDDVTFSTGRYIVIFRRRRR